MACRRSDVSQPPPSWQQAKVDLLNARLVAEMGEVSGLPKFKWMWSEEAVHPFRVMSNGADPKPVYNYRCQCGVDVPEGEHEPVTVTTDGVEETIPCPERVIAEPCYELRRLVTLWKNTDGTPIRHQWLLWGWVPPPAREVWEQTYGDGLDYAEYANGSYEPITVAGVVAVMRKRRMIPTMDLTMEFCRLLVESQKITYAQKMSEWARLQEIAKAHKHSEAVDMLKDKMGNLNFGTKASLLPGRKGSVSFNGLPTTPLSPKEARKAEAGRSRELIVKERRSIVKED
jgi:hypothetical protein